jgi:hypothetical protein
MRFPILTQNDQSRIAKKVMELGNVGAGALIFGQALSGNQYRLDLATLGFFALIIGYVISIIIMWKKS